MNREIKFRALKDDMSDCRFVYGHLIYRVDLISGELYPRIHERIGYPHSVGCIKGTEGQFTGLYDQNGKEIYEGDILNIGATDLGFIHDYQDNPAKYEVKFAECDYILYRIGLQLIWGRLSRLSELNWQCEVIGNIHENPELLK